MRRISDRRPSGLFRGSELTRLLSMLLMLTVLAMMMRRAADENTWRFFTGEPRGVREAAEEAAEPVPVRKLPRLARKASQLADVPRGAIRTEIAAAGPTVDARQPLPAAAATANTEPATVSAEPSIANAEPAAVNAEPAAVNAAPGAGVESAAVPPTPAAAETEPVATVSPPATSAVAAQPTESQSAPQEPGLPPQLAEKAGEPAAPGPAESPAASSANMPADPPGPLHRPHLPSQPEIIYQPGEQPVGPPEPLDEDPAELEKFEYESKGLTDSAPLAKEEMLSYWRLMRWEQSQSPEEMLKRARGNVYYGDLLERPQDFRGALIKVKLHVVQVRQHEDLPDNPLGIKANYQAVGWNDASQAHFYFCIFTDLPKGMHVGSRVYDEGTFVGYFLKTLVYEDGKGSRIKAPILIGQMLFHPAVTVPRNETEWMWPWIAGGVCLVLYAARWGWKFAFGRQPEPAIRGILSRRDVADEEAEGIDIEEWLEQAEAPAAENEINSAVQHDLNGSRDLNGHNGSAHGDGLQRRPDHGLDWTEDRER
jgi:hypothetical protein